MLSRRIMKNYYVIGNARHQHSLKPAEYVPMRVILKDSPAGPVKPHLTCCFSEGV
jgi:hypothetical protein